MIIVIANWKSNGSLPAIGEWCGEMVDKFPQIHIDKPGCQVCVCPPHIFISEFADKLGSLVQQPASGFALGSQDLSPYAMGAYTGEVNAQMLKEFFGSYAILGHSERRTLFGENSTALSQKVKQSFASDITPIFCVGETAGEREKISDVLDEQLEPLLQELKHRPDAKAIVAYEPVWAIGTGQAATPKVANEAHLLIKDKLAKIELTNSIKVVYGGSVTADNAKDFTGMPDIDGLLVGGASLKADSLLQIVQNVQNMQNMQNLV
ncbi:MAG: triose-phosphate isomerase [Candidatus Portiera sp.]|nr:triose-phosphate isomerase [Portiera sp.]